MVLPFRTYNFNPSVTFNFPSPLISGFLITGAFCLFCCFASDDKKVIKWAEKTGNHWLLIFLVFIAYGLAAAIRGLVNESEK